MTTSYDRRLSVLEQQHYRAALPTLRIIHTIISPEREVEGVYLAGQHFDRAAGESVDELEQRAMRAVGWDE
jgi:hypothetical protein